MVAKGGKKIEEVSLVDRLVSLIHDAIIDGELEPGSHIGIKKLSDVYGVSMIPVREALARLLATGLVRAENNRGYFVASQPTASEFRQFIEARELIESAVIGFGFDNATPKDIKRLRSLNEKMRKLSVSKKEVRMSDWHQLNKAFHDTLVGLARNSYLSNYYSGTAFANVHFQLVRSYPVEFTSLEKLVRQHDTMIDALEAKDKEKFFSVLSEHIHNIRIDE